MNLHFSYGQKLKKLKCTYNDPYNEIILKLKTQQKHGFLNLKFQFRKKKKKSLPEPLYFERKNYSAGRHRI